MPFSKNIRNKMYQNEVREHINNILGTDFTQDEMLEIYCKIGNACNHQKTINFINSNYKLKVLGDK